MIERLYIAREDGKPTSAAAISRMLGRDHGVKTSPGGWTVVSGWDGRSASVFSVDPTIPPATMDRRLRALVEGINAGSSPFVATGH